MALVTLSYDVDTGLRAAVQELAAVAAIPLDQGELTLLGMSLVSDFTAPVADSLLRRTVALETNAQGDDSFPTATAKADATRRLFGGVLELALPGRVTAQEPIVEDFIPTDFADLISWWRPSMGMVEDPITHSVDLWTAFGLGNPVLTQTGIAPTHEESDANWNDQQSIIFDGAGPDTLSSVNAASFWKFLHDGTGSTIILVVRPTATGIILSTAPLVASVGVDVLYDAAAGTFEWLIGNGGAVVIDQVTAAGSAPVGLKRWLALRYEEGRAGNEWSIVINGVEVFTGNSAAAPSAANPADTLMIGDRVDGGNPYDGSVTDIITVGSYITDAELAAIGVSLEQIYGPF